MAIVCAALPDQSNPPLISVFVISHRQYALKCNEEDTSSQSYKIRGIDVDSAARQSHKVRLIIFISLPYFLTVAHVCLCPINKTKKTGSKQMKAKTNAATRENMS